MVLRESPSAFDKKKRSRKFRRGFVRNLLDREIGTQYWKHSSIKSTYAHPYQLLDSIKPSCVYELNLHSCETRTRDGAQFGTMAECLGFSPDGRYLAFHTHARNAISLLHYSGVEGAKISQGVACVSSIFGKRQIFDHTELLRTWNYTTEKSVASWWTDDSSTLILQLKLVDFNEDDRNDADDMMARPNRILNDSRGVWTGRRRNGVIPPDLPEIVQSHLRAQDQFENASNQSFIADVRIDDEDDGEPSVNVEVVENSIEDVQEGPSTSAIAEGDEEEEEDEDEEEEEILMEKGETSRTIPYWMAVESASEMAKDGRNLKNQTSRTMTVYHSLTSSMLNDGPVDDDDEPMVETTSTTTSESTRSERLRKWIDKSRGASGDPMLNKTGFGYSRTTKRSAAWSSYAERLRDAMTEQRPFEPERPRLPDFSADDPRVDIRNSFVFLAYNVQENSVAPLMFASVYRKFHCHMRNRRLMVAYNNDFIETYLLDGTDGKWRIDRALQLARKMRIPSPIFYKNEVEEGRRLLLDRPTTGSVIGHFYCYNAFLSPIQQLGKSLLYKDMPEWFSHKEVLRRDAPNLSRCRLITDDTIAATISYQESKNSKPIHHGLIIRLSDQSVTLYPDYLKYLQILFTHHLPDLLPRQWTYLNPAPVHQQEWFREAVMDMSNKDEFNNYSRMTAAYDFISEFWNSTKSTSNPVFDSKFFDSIHADQFLTKYVYLGSGLETRGVRSAPNSKERLVALDKFVHPTDPFAVFNHANIWFVSMPARTTH